MKKIFIIFLAFGSTFYVMIAKAKQSDDHTRAVTAIAFDKKGKAIITGSQDGALCKRNVASGQGQVISELGKVDQVKRIGKFLAVVQSKPLDEGAVKNPRPEFYNLDDLTYKSSGAVNGGRGHIDAITAVEIINSKSMVSADQAGKVVFLYNCMRSVVLNAGSCIHRMSAASPSRIFGINFYKDRIYKFDPELKQVWAQPFDNEWGPMAAIAALSESLLVVGHQKGIVNIMSDKTGENKSIAIHAHADGIVDVKKLTKRLFVTVGNDGTAKVWDVKTRTCKKEFDCADGKRQAKITAFDVHWNKKKTKIVIASGYNDGVTVIHHAQL